MRMFFSSLLASVSMTLFAGSTSLWLRQNALSPDGKTLAFVYQGDIYTVPASGGEARPLTGNSGYNMRPVWSPDGKTIAFSSNRMGGFDLYTIPSGGGAAVRLTTHSSNEYAETFLDNENVLFLASIQPSASSGVFPSSVYPQLYQVNVKGGRPRLFSGITMESLSINRHTGELLYQDKKGYEDSWRKHHTSPVTRDVWMTQTKQGGGRTFRQLSRFEGENRNPVWAADGKSYYYLNEKSGSMNIYKVSGGAETQLTHFKKNPVRYLSASAEGTLSFSYDGELYTLREGFKPQKVKIEIVNDPTRQEVFPQFIYSGAGSLSIDRSEKEIAFLAKGDVYVTSMDYRTTRRITDTPEEERSVSFSPDGRQLIYASERDGVWGIYLTTLVRSADRQFTYAHELKEEPLVRSKEVCFLPKFSPDGKEVAFFANRSELRVINLETKMVRTALPGKWNYSYSDNDLTFDWSPDSKWLLAPYIGVGGWQNKDIALVKSDGSEVINLTESGYSDTQPEWVLGGKAVLFQSDRQGFRSHGSWGAQSDVFLMFLDGEEYDKFQMSKEERALLADAEKQKKEDAAKKQTAQNKGQEKAKEDGKNAAVKKDTVEPAAKFDLENRKERTVLITPNSSNLGNAYLSKDGRKLYYQVTFEGGYDLWVADRDERSTRILVKGLGHGRMLSDAAGQHIFIGGNSIRKINLSSGAATNIPFRAPYDHRPAAQRTYIYDHVVSLLKNKFYLPDMGGVAWDDYAKTYSRFLPQITNGYDFAELLSELLGELNASHTGARYSGSEPAQKTATLGAFFDENYEGDGLLVAEVIKQGPLDKSDSRIRQGSIITRIDGQLLRKGEDYYPLLAGKEGERVTLTVTDAKGKDEFEQEVKPVSYEQQSVLLYNRWVKAREKATDAYSKGKIGYVHIKSMNSESFRNVYLKLLGAYRNKEAVVVDTRHNGGGWLHNDLAILLSGRTYQTYNPRGQFVAQEPFTQWTKPSVVLVCEDNYSNANGFPFIYKQLGIGKLVGTPMAGTMTAVWWEEQVDNSLVVGVPQVGVKDLKGNYIENQDLVPNITVYQTPEELLCDNDTQLKRAIEELLKSL